MKLWILLTAEEGRSRPGAVRKARVSDLIDADLKKYYDTHCASHGGRGPTVLALREEASKIYARAMGGEGGAVWKACDRFIARWKARHGLTRSGDGRSEGPGDKVQLPAM